MGEHKSLQKLSPAVLVEDDHQRKTNHRAKGVGDQVVDVGQPLEVKKVVPEELVALNKETEEQTVQGGVLKGGPPVKEEDVDAEGEGHDDVEEEFHAETLEGDGIEGDPVKVEEYLMG